MYAHEHGVPYLTIEPMSCTAEPPTLPEEIRQKIDRENILMLTDRK